MFWKKFIMFNKAEYIWSKYSKKNPVMWNIITIQNNWFLVY